MKLKSVFALVLLILSPTIGFSNLIWLENLETIPIDTNLGAYTTTDTVISSAGTGGTVKIVADPYFGSTKALEIDRVPASSRSVTFTPAGSLGNNLSPTGHLTVDFYQFRRSATDSGSGGASEQLRWSLKAASGASIVDINYRPDRGRLNTGNMAVHPTAYNTVRTFHFFINNSDEELIYLNPITNEERTLPAGMLEFYADGDTGFTPVSLRVDEIGETIASFQFYMNTGLNGRFFADNISISELTVIPELRSFPTTLGSGELNILQNGNFERRAISGIPDSWTRQYSSTGGSSTRSNEQTYYGDYALKLVDGSTSQSEGLWSSLIPINPGVSYTAGGFIYRTSANSGGQIYIKYYNDSLTEVGSVSTTGSTVNAWQILSVTSQAPATASYARVLCYSSIPASGTVYFDAISFIRAASQGIVDNPDMELDISGPGYPINWTSNYDAPYTQAGSVSVGTDSNGKYLVLTDISTSLPAHAMTRVPVIGNMTYTLSGDIYWHSGDAPKLYIKYRNEYSTIVATDYISPSTSGSWDTHTVTLKAPEDAVEAHIVAYIGIPETGTSYFDNIHLTPTGVIQRFIAPSALGTGLGTSASNAAKYNDPTFWANVQSLLATQSVVVDVRNGNYNINSYTNDRFHLDGVGSDDHALVMKGRNPYGTIFRRTASADNSDRRTFVWFRNAKNLVIRHLHWEDQSNNPDKVSGYALILGGAEDPGTKNIVLEGCSFIGLTQNYYGAIGFHGPATHRSLVWNNEFVNVGFSWYSHMIYNSYATYDHQILHNYFEDSMGGSYVRHRDDCHDILIADNRFVSTGSAHSVFPFIEIATFNDETTDNEKWGYNFVFVDNHFEYPAGTNSSNVAIRFLHYGYNPIDANNVEWNYLLNAAERNTLLTGTTAQKVALIKANFDLDFSSEVLIEGNTRSGYHAYDMSLVSESYWNWVPDYGGNGTYNISALGGL